jgi:hypothetical protein
MVAVVVFSICVAVTVFVATRKDRGGRFRPLGSRKRRNVGPWDERAEEGLVVYESGEFRD